MSILAPFSFYTSPEHNPVRVSEGTYAAKALAVTQVGSRSWKVLGEVEVGVKSKSLWQYLQSA
jgi:hypothetical protein